jgi:hypothetical protein
MKKILLPVMFTLCGFLLTGCAITIKSDTLRAIPIETTVKPLPLTADLKVSEQKTSGEVSGLPTDIDMLTNIAIGIALGQNPPSVDKPDVLVGMDRFTEQTGQHLKVTVTGYPAYYTNFRTTDGKGLDMSFVPQTYQVKNTTFYFTPRYMLWQGFDIEGGIAGKVVFGGLDFGMAFDTYDPSVNILANFGAMFDLPSELRLAVGLSSGFWYRGADDYRYYYYGDYYDGRYYNDDWGIAGFFSRLSWHGIEFSYRWLIGDRGWHQFMIGYIF